MDDHGWFSYIDNLCHNATLDHGWPWLIFVLRESLSQCDVDHGWPWLTIVHFHIEAIFDIMRYWTRVYDGWPWLSRCDVGPRDNLCHNVTIVDHDCQWLTMVYFHIETILNPRINIINIINPMNNIIPREYETLINPTDWYYNSKGLINLRDYY